MNWYRKNRARGFAVPLVVIICFCILTFASGMFYFRKEVKQENVVNINFLQANFLAQSAINHMLVKIRTLPQETFDVGVIQKGFCPFKAVTSANMPPTGTKSNVGLDLLRADCNVASVPWKINEASFVSGNWIYEIASMTVISAFTSQSGGQVELVLTVQIIASASVFEPRGKRGWRTERMVKTLEIRRPQ